MALLHYPGKTGRLLSIGASSSDAALRMKVGIPSGPGALWGFKSFSNFFTPFELIDISSIEVKGLGPLSGMLSVSSCV